MTRVIWESVTVSSQTSSTQEYKGPQDPPAPPALRGPQALMVHLEGRASLVMTGPLGSQVYLLLRLLSHSSRPSSRWFVRTALQEVRVCRVGGV